MHQNSCNLQNFEDSFTFSNYTTEISSEIDQIDIKSTENSFDELNEINFGKVQQNLHLINYLGFFFVWFRM